MRYVHRNIVSTYLVALIIFAYYYAFVKVVVDFDHE